MSSGWPDGDAPRFDDLILEHIGNLQVVFDRGRTRVGGADLLRGGAGVVSGSADSAALAVLMTNDAPTVEVVLGAIAGGARLVSLPLPSRAADPEAYLAFIRSACAAQGAAEIVVSDQYADLVALSGVAVRSHSELGSRPVVVPTGRGFELVQYSSGSTANPKAILLTAEQLGANIAAIVETLEPQRGDCTVSWLPLSHDMGLVGMLLTSIAAVSPAWVGPADVVLLDPADFLRDPALWLEAMSSFGATFTAAPDFGFRLCLDRLRPAARDLSSLRCVIVGGEPVRGGTLRFFAEAFAPDGFSDLAFCPAYGMAEIGLAATMTRTDRPWSSLHVDALELTGHHLALAEGVEDTGRTRTELVSCGSPVKGYEVRIDAEPGRIGRIVIEGPSIGSDAVTGGSYADSSGAFCTGDLGVLVDGTLVVTGRDDDYINTNGRNTFAPPIEDAVGEVDGVRAGRVALFGLPSGEWVAAAEVIAAEALSEVEYASLCQTVSRTIVGHSSARPNEVVLVRRGRLPMTSSGKLQRRETVRRYLAGELELATG